MPPDLLDMGHPANNIGKITRSLENPSPTGC
jgi:hypothetical protein